MPVVSERVIENIQDCTPELKRLALDALDIKTYASTDYVEVRGVIPLELPTTGRTWGCLCFYRNASLLVKDYVP